MKILNFPKYRQTFEYDCGATALQSVLAYYGFDLRAEKVMKLCQTNKAGTEINNILKTAKRFELQARDKQLTLSKLKKYLAKKIPVILPLQAWAEHKIIDWTKIWSHGHYTVVCFLFLSFNYSLSDL